MLIRIRIRISSRKKMWRIQPVPQHGWWPILTCDPIHTHIPHFLCVQRSPAPRWCPCPPTLCSRPASHVSSPRPLPPREWSQHQQQTAISLWWVGQQICDLGGRSKSRECLVVVKIFGVNWSVAELGPCWKAPAPGFWNPPDFRLKYFIFSSFIKIYRIKSKHGKSGSARLENCRTMLENNLSVEKKRQLFV